MNQELKTNRDTAEEYVAAVKAVDLLLLRRLQSLQGSLHANHPARLTSWKSPLRDASGIFDPEPAAGDQVPGETVLIAYTAAEFARLSPFARYLEIVRAQAEAWLVHEQLGLVLLKDEQREDLILRSLGITPSNEPGRLAEIAAYHEFSPKHMMVTLDHFRSGIHEIEQTLGTATALFYGLLLVLGIREQPEILRYGTMLQTVFDELTLASVPGHILARLGDGRIQQADFNTQFSLLSQLRDESWRLLPRHPGTEFRFNRMLEMALSRERTLVATPLALAALDAVILSKLCFRVQLLTSEPDFSLEVLLNGRYVYWEPHRRSELTLIPPRGAQRSDVFRLFALTYHQLGLGHTRQGQLSKGIRAFRHALALDPNNPEIQHDLGNTLLRSNQLNEAIDMCQQAVQSRPDFAEAYVTLASGLLGRQRYEEAIDVLKRAIRLRPDFAEAFNNLGFAYEQKGESERAIIAYKTAIRQRPDYAQAYYNLGNSYLSTRKYEMAITAYQQTVRLNPKFVRAWYNLGQAFYQRRRLTEAAEAYRRVLAINPKHAGALYNLGIVYRDLGLTDKAVESIEKAVALNPNLLR